MTTVPDPVSETVTSNELHPSVAGCVRRAAEEYAKHAGLDAQAVDELVAMFTSPLKPAKTRTSAEKSRARRARLKTEGEGRDG